MTTTDQAICDLYLEDYHDELMEAAGWEPCYHRGGANWHYDVKVGYGDAYRGFHDKLAERPNIDRERVTEIASGEDGLEDWELRFWWESALPDFLNDDVTGHPDDALIPADDAAKYGRYKYEAWQCGRSGGYVNVPALESDPVLMAKLGKWLAGQRDYFNSRDWGEWLAEQAIENYDEELVSELASPRPERVEA